MCCECGGILLAAGKSNQSVREDINPEWIVRGHIDVDTQVKFTAADEVGLVKVPANKNGNVGMVYGKRWAALLRST